MHIKVNTIDIRDYNIIILKVNLMKINMIHNFICNFHNTEVNLQYGHAINANGHFSICLYYFSKFQ